MNILSILQIAAAIFTIAFGLYSVFAPRRIKPFTGLEASSPRAITEIRSVLSDDPNRPDLQVMLARAYYRSGQKVEAAETAIQLLKKFPHCLDALRILVDVLPGTTRSEDTQVYRQRLQQLDPYAAFSAGSVFHSDQVSDASINLEKLEYEPSLISAPQQEWAATLGVKLKEPAAEKPPEWLTAAVGTAEVASSPDRAHTQAAKSDVPEWLREAGWQESTGAAQEGPVDFSGEQPAGIAEAEPIARAELPSWLQSMAPQEVVDGAVESSQVPAESASTGVDETMENLLAGLGRGEEKPAPAAGAEVPDWLSSMRTVSDEEPQVAVPPATETGIPDWLSNMRPVSDLEEPAPPAPAAETEKPDWLGGLTAVPGTEEPAAAAQPAEEAGAADWLSGMKSVPGFEEQASAVPPAVEPATTDWLGGQPVAGVEAPAPDAQPADESDLPDWLKGISSSTGFEEPASAASAQPAEEFPTWLQQDKPFVPEPPRPVTAPFKPPTTPLAAKPAPVEPAAPTGPTGPSRPLSIEDDAMAWLESLALKQGARPEELLTRPEDRPKEAPASVQNLAGQAAQPAAPVPEKTAAVPVAPKPASMEPAAPAGPTGPTKPLSIEDDAMAWLESLALRQGARSEELLTRPEDRPLEPPASVQNLAAQAAAESQPAAVEPEPEPEPVSPVEPFRPAADDVTSWLKELDKETNPPPLIEESPAPSTDLPDWLKGLEQPAAATRMEPVEVPDELPEWLRAPATPAPAADEAPVWAREEAAPVEHPTPTMPEEWVPVEKLEQAPEAVVGAAHPEPVPVSPVEKVPPMPTPEPSTTLPSKPGTLGELAKIPAQDKEADTLMLAQNSLDDGKLNASMQIYSRLIKKGRLLDEVIHDLREAIYRYPVDVIIWQTLGDACMRANRLQDALDAYTKAEELLR